MPVRLHEGGGGMEHYERVKVLGKGTFGRAWLVKDRKSRQLWVAKEIKCESKQDLEEALAEARVLSDVEHYNIISYKDVLRTSSKLVTIVMEYADDGDVAEKIARRKFRNQYFEEDLICKWFVQLVQALDYLHQRGILHRDIKTANLFLLKNGALKLGDFGIARILDRNAERVSARTCRTAVGTPMYMCPELCQGEAYGQKADMWSLGCVLYEMCSLRPAFMAHSMEGLVAKIKRGNHDKHMPKMYSPELRGLVTALLQVNPELRPTCKDILDLAFLSSYVATSPATLITSGASTKEQLLAQPALDRAPIDQSQSVPEILVLDDAGARKGHGAAAADSDRRRSMQPEHERAMRGDNSGRRRDASPARLDRSPLSGQRDRSPLGRAGGRDASPSGRYGGGRDRSPAGRQVGRERSPGNPTRSSLNPVSRLREPGSQPSSQSSSREPSPAQRDRPHERGRRRDASRERLAAGQRDASASSNGSSDSASPSNRRPHLHVQGQHRGRSNSNRDSSPSSRHQLHADAHPRGRSNSPAARYGSDPSKPSIASSDLKDLASWYKDHGIRGHHSPHQQRSSPLRSPHTAQKKLPKLY